jgi:hypothetical protein
MSANKITIPVEILNDKIIIPVEILDDEDPALDDSDRC